MAEHIDEFRRRRAIRGFGARKAYLLEQYWQLENEITHFIIAGSAGSTTAAERRATAERLRDKTAEELRNITQAIE